MSTTETKPSIPSADAVTPAAGGGRAFRFSKGRIITGREKTDSLREVPRLVGVVTRIGIHEGRTQEYNKLYMQLECDMMTAEGEIHVHVGLLDNETFELRPTVAALAYGWCLTQVQPDQVVMFTASLGEAWTDPQGRSREASTYVNLATVDANNLAHPVYRPKADPTAPKRSNLEKWAQLREELESHPLYAPRPASRQDDHAGPSHLSELCRECEQRGWPTPDQAPGEWLQIMARGYKHPVRLKLSDYSDDEWGEIRQTAGKATQIPALLIPAKERLESTFVDPFA